MYSRQKDNKFNIDYCLASLNNPSYILWYINGGGLFLNDRSYTYIIRGVSDGEVGDRNRSFRCGYR